MVQLIEVDRTNERAMVLLELKPEQRSWVILRQDFSLQALFSVEGTETA
jgi:hypothetical protein